MEYLTDQDYMVAKTNGISHQQAYHRFFIYGWEKERAITEPISAGGLWGKYKAICEQTGVKKSTFYKRMERGQSPEKASV